MERWRGLQGLLALALAIPATAAAMCLYVLDVGRMSASLVALAIGLTNSIMFPVIFIPTPERSTASSAATSGILCTCIIGGAVLPPLTVMIAGSAGYVMAFTLPAFCYALLRLISVAGTATSIVSGSAMPNSADH